MLVEQQPPQGVLVCDHAGLVINKFSLFALGPEVVRIHAARTSLQPGGGDRIHPENARKSGHGAQLLAQCVRQHIYLDVQGAVLALVVRQ